MTCLQSAPLGFGFTGHYPVSQVIRLAQQAEDAGFSSVWLAEDYFESGVFSLATACALKTSHIKIGIGVINPFTRHPALSAMEAATLDELSGGRIILAMGASNKKWIETQAGIPYVKPITATREAVAILKGLTSGESVQLQGAYFHTGSIQLHNPPLRPSMPIFMGVKGEVALAAAGEVADGVLLSAGSPLAYVSYARDCIARGAEKAGRNPNQVQIAAYLPVVMHEEEQIALDQARPIAARYMGLHGNHPILTSAGLTPAELQPFRDAFLAGTAPNVTVSDRQVKTLVVAGTPAQCTAQIAAYVQAGVNLPIVFEAVGVHDASHCIDLAKKHLLTP